MTDGANIKRQQGLPDFLTFDFLTKKIERFFSDGQEKYIGRRDEASDSSGG